MSALAMPIDQDLLPGFTVEWETIAPAAYWHGARRIFAKDEADARHRGSTLIARDMNVAEALVRIVRVRRAITGDTA